MGGTEDKKSLGNVRSLKIVLTFEGSGVEACAATFLFSEHLCKRFAPTAGLLEYEVEGMECMDCMMLPFNALEASSSVFASMMQDRRQGEGGNAPPSTWRFAEEMFFNSQ